MTLNICAMPSWTSPTSTPRAGRRSPKVSSRWPWDLGSRSNVQFFGALFAAVGASAWSAWRPRSWYGYDVLYAAAGTFATVALVATFLHWDLFGIRPRTSVAFVALYVTGAVMGFYPYVGYVLGRGEERGPVATSRS
jgi:hypothetical protein